jgi:hypothetical protein
LAGSQFVGYAPASISIGGLWGSGPSDVWASSPYGKYLHWNGTSWTLIDSDLAVSSMWGSGTSDIWGVTNNAEMVKHYDGGTWSTVQITGLGIPSDVSGTAPADVWVAGFATGGRIFHFDGTSWTQRFVSWDNRSPNGLWASTPSSAWAVGSQGLALHWDGMTWSEVPTGTARSLAKVWGIDAAGTTSVWAVGDAATILRYRP